MWEGSTTRWRIEAGLCSVRGKLQLTLPVNCDLYEHYKGDYRSCVTTITRDPHSRLERMVRLKAKISYCKHPMATASPLTWPAPNIPQAHRSLSFPMCAACTSFIKTWPCASPRPAQPRSPSTISVAQRV